MSEVYIGVTVSNGEVYHIALQTELRAPSRPNGPGWTEELGLPIGTFYWKNLMQDDYIEYFLAKNERCWAHRKDARGMPAHDAVTVVSWRRLSLAEHEQFNVDRPYRNALRDLDGKIIYDIAAARACHQNVLRRERAQNMPILDILWMRAMAKADIVEADAIEVLRQKWRDGPIDPRIFLATTVEELKTILVE